jgi:hypothetical protein
MADDASTISALVDQLLDEFDPRTAPPVELRGRQFDLRLAWVSFPEGSRGRGLPPGLQRLVDDRLGAAGATPGPRQSPGDELLTW